jgi:hypothetical protein
MDKLIDVSVIVINITCSHRSPLFRMLEDDDNVTGSNFAKFFIKKSGKDPTASTFKLWWGTVKQFVVKSMQNSRSVTTQSIKKEFIGTL